MSDAARRALDRRRWRDGALIALALGGLACALALGTWGRRLDMLVYDLGMDRFGRPPPPGIVIVAIDEASVQAIGRWPWSRAVHATLLSRLAHLPQPPRAIGIDVLVSEPDPDPRLDALLAAAIREGAPVVLPVHWDTLGARGTFAVEPAPALRDSVRLGAVGIRADSDGVMRDSYLRARVVGDPSARYPSFALAVLEAGGELPHPRAQALADADGGDEAEHLAGDAQSIGRFAIRYAGPPDTVDHVSYVDVLSGKVPPERLAGRYVLIGMTAQGLGDTVATPVNRTTLAMPGIEVHANALYTLRSGDGIRRVAPASVAAFSAALLLLLVATLGRFGPRVALPLAVGSIPLAVGASILALDSGLWFSPVPYCVGAVLAYPLLSWRRLERAVARLDLEIAHLAQVEPLNAPLPQNTAPRARSTDGDALEARLHALRRAASLVRETRRFFAEALAAMPTAMLVADLDSRVVLANPRAAALFDVEGVEELLGLDLVRLLGEFTPAAGAFDWAHALEQMQPLDGGIAVEVQQPRGQTGAAHASTRADAGARSAAAHDAYVVAVAMVDLQGLRRLIVTMSDIEPVKQAQRDREEVLAFVSHDLRSPASAIVLLADLHLQNRVQTPLPELLEEVKRLAGRTLTLSDGLVRAAQAQTQPLQRESVLLAALLDEALADLRARARAAEVELVVDVAHPALTAQVDRLLVGRAIGNLVGNALRHAPPGTSVLVDAAVRDGQLRVRVRDHGQGLNAQQLEQLARGDAGLAAGDARGVGLGLLFVQRVARRHGGALHAWSPAPGRGACFEIALPASSAAAAST